MLVSFPSLAGLTARDRRVLAPAMGAAGRTAGEEGRLALAELFRTLSDALAATIAPATVPIDALADLDDSELTRLGEGLIRQREREEADGRAGRAAFFDDLRVALISEQDRRHAVLAAFDLALRGRTRLDEE